MQHVSPATRPLASRVALLFAALLAAFGFATAASAAPVTYTDVSGASITLANDEFVPGSHINFTGKNFKGGPGAGVPQVAIKIDDNDTALTYGGTSAAFPPFEPGLPTFTTDQNTENGSFSGWIELPSTTPLAGSGPGGKHWLRILSGVPSTGGSTNGSVTVPITFVAPFAAVPPLQFGFTNTPAAGSKFYPGTTLTPTAPSAGAQGTYTVKGGTFPANEAVSATFDGNPIALNPAVTTDADGSFSTPIALGGTPMAPLAGGDHTVALTAGGMTKSVTVKVVAHTTTLLTPTIRDGGTAVVKVTGYQGIGGTGQRIALIGAGDTVLSCTTAAADGSALLAATVTGANGLATLRVASGTGCVPPLVTDPVPRFVPQIGAGLTIAPDAPTAGTAFTHGTVGVAFPVTGSGFGAGEPVQAKLDDLNLGAPLTATAEGAITGNLTLPANTSLGQHVLTFVSATKTAADTITAIAAPTIKVTPGEAVAPGSKLTVDLTGFRRGFAREDGATGQKVGIRIDTGAIIACIQTDNDGTGSGSVDLPADIAAGEHTLRFLAGSSCVSGQSNDAPSRSIPVTFTVKAAPVVEPQPTTPQPTTPVPTTPAVDVQAATKLKTLKGGKELELSIDAGQPTRVKVAVKTKSKFKLTSKGKKKIVTVVKVKTVRPTAGKARTVKLVLTAEGKALLKKLGKFTVVVTITPDGAGQATTRTFTLRK